MKCLPRLFVFVALSTVTCLTAQNPPTAVTPPPAATSVRSLRLSPAVSNGATFTNPKEGQIVHPGETIPVNLVVDPGIKPVKGVGIISPMGTSTEFREAPPYSFTFKVPDKDSGGNGPLIGFQELTLFGTIIGREKDFVLATTTVDVEEPDLPVSLEVVGPMLPLPNRLDFSSLGEDNLIAIDAKFPNGHEFDVTQSTYLSLSSENTAIAFLADDGIVAAVGAGQTHIVVSYRLGHEQKQVLVPVTVKVETSSQSVDISPAFFNFGGVPSNAVSNPLEITITNRTHEKVHISKVDRVGGFLVGPENCSDTILPTNGSCTITVRFAPISAGSVHSEISIYSDYGEIGNIFLFGKGT